MQHFLRFIGIDRSYLFLNSFIYPIFGQYSMDLRPLAQDPRSPITQHRNRIFDKAIIDGDVRLVVAVGTAAKESVVTWIRAHGGSAQSDALHNANMGSIPNRVRVVGVLHPGGAAGGSTATIKADFQRAVNRIRGWVADDSGWLPADPGMTRNLSTPYPYSSAAIPFRDFPFGTCPRLGRGGTSSNRSDDQRAIRLFSAAGKYNASGAHLSDPSTATAAARATTTTPAIFRTSRRGPTRDRSIRPARGPRPPPHGSASRHSRGPTSRGSASDRIHRSASVRSIAAASSSSASSSSPTRRRRNDVFSAARSPARPGSGCKGSCGLRACRSAT
jgi:hypothetical protein